MSRKGQGEGLFLLVLIWVTFTFGILIVTDGDGISSNPVQDGEQIGEIDKILTTGNGDTCTVFVENRTYTLRSQWDCTDASTGFVLYRYDGDFELFSPEEVRRSGGVVP